MAKILKGFWRYQRGNQDL